MSTVTLINGAARVSLRWNSLPSLTLRRQVGSTRRPTCLLGTAAVPWTVPAAVLSTNRRAAGQRRSCRRRPGGALISWSFNEHVDRGPGRRLPLIRCGVGGGRDRPLAVPIRFSILALTDPRAGSTIRSTRPGQSGKRLVPGAPQRAPVPALIS